MNSFGRLFRINIYGESHGPEVGVVIDGCPAGLPIGVDEFLLDLARRRGGRPGTTARAEQDRPEIGSGVFSGRTTGSPILIRFRNADVRSDDYDAFRATPRPGHVDFVAEKKFGGFQDYRGAGHFSGRLTAGLVAAGVIAKKIIAPAAVKARLLEAGGDRNVSRAVRAAQSSGDSIGGIVECRGTTIPIGLGEPFFDSVESLVSHIVFSIPGIKAIEFGAGFRAAKTAGSRLNDAILDGSGTTRTNNAGGINGGISNGNPIVFRVSVRPTASISRPQWTVDLKTGKRTRLRIAGRHDCCFAIRVPVIVEAALAVVLADLLLIEQKIPRVYSGEI